MWCFRHHVQPFTSEQSFLIQKHKEQMQIDKQLTNSWQFLLNSINTIETEKVPHKQEKVKEHNHKVKCKILELKKKIIEK